MTRKRAPWRLVYLSYPCPVCEAGPGEDCYTQTGKITRQVHADRARMGDRCPRCATLLDADHEPDQLCPRCELIRSLEVERSTHYKRRDP